MERSSSYQRIRIESVTRSELIKDNEDRWRLFTPSGNNIFRIWIMGIITEKYTGENNYVGLKVEDGSGWIVVKTWDSRLDEFRKWDKIEVLGKVQISERDEEINVFLTPDIIQSISDDNWFLVHRLKIIQQLRRPTSIEVKSATVGGVELGVASIEDLKMKLKEAVKKFDAGEGVTYDQLVKIFPNIDEVQIDEAITELLESGEFFEPKAGIYSSAIDS
ncbi:MAG: OB-fold nucleic acid binding domain-containing protein [Candidatus Hodarchaeales archaeon]|jgi:RPA family protein